MTDPETPTRNKVGRPKGLGKVPGSGRRKGVPNKDRAATLEAIRTYSDPVGFLESVCRGLLIECRDTDGKDQKATILTRPSMEQRITAATILAKKVLPDVKSVELEVTDNTVTIQVFKHPHGPDKQPEPDATSVVVLKQGDEDDETDQR